MTSVERATAALVRHLSLIVAIAAVIVLNVVSLFYHARADFTSDRRFTLSDTTAGILAKLEDVVNVYVYFSEKLPPSLVRYVRSTQDTLKEFQAAADGNLRVVVTDPAQDPLEEQRAKERGVNKIQMNVIEEDRQQLIEGYFGLAVEYEGRIATIPVVSDSSNLEFDLVSSIKKVLGGKSRKVGFLDGHGEHSLDGEYSEVRKAIERLYFVERVRDTARGAPVPADVGTLVIAGPKTLAERDLYEIDQFVMRGGKLIVLDDMVEVDEHYAATEKDSGMNRLLERYGARINPDLVLDESALFTSFRQGGSDVTLPYPHWVVVRREFMQQDHPTVRGLGSLVLPWPSSVSTATKMPDDNLVRLLTTTPRAWRQGGGGYQILPSEITVPDQFGKYVLGVILNARWMSAFNGRPVPPIERDPGLEAGFQPEDTRQPVPEGVPTTLVLIGNSRFLTNEHIQRSPANLVFFQNLVDWLGEDPELIPIRSKQVRERLLDPMLSERAKDTVKLVHLAVVPGVAALLIVAWLMLGKWRRRAFARSVRGAS